MISLLIFIIIFLILSAFFSGSEIAFVSANRISIEIEKNKETRKAGILRNFYNNPNDFLSTMLIGNNIALVIFTTLMTRLIEPGLTKWISQEWLLLLLSTILITLVVLVFGEFIPKTFFRIYSDRMIRGLAYPLSFFSFILRPITLVMTWLSTMILKYILRAPIGEGEDAITRLDLENFVQGQMNEDDERHETNLFKKALHLKKVRVKEGMIPRTEIEHIDVDEDLSDLLTKFRETSHSRILVSEGDVDNILGYVHHQKLLDKPKKISDIVIDMPFVPEAMNVKDLLIDFISKGTSIACVVDEFGGTAGIITLEDILEEIFGEIEDEYDEEEYVESKINDDEYLFSGRLEIDYLNEKYEHLDFPLGEYETLSGLIVMTSGDIPMQGEEIILGDYKYIILHESEKKIETVRVVKLNRPDN